MEGEENRTEEEVTDIVFNIVGACAWTITTVLILFFNTMCLIILPKVGEFHHSTRIFLQSMTVSDLMLGVFFYFPMTGIWLTGSGVWPYGDALCYIQAWMIRQALPACSISLLLVTTDRYIAVVYPLKYKTLLTSRRAKIIVCILWIMTNIYTLILTALSQWKNKYNDVLFLCQFGETTNTLAAFIVTVLTLFVVVVIILMYVQILHIARSQVSRIATQHHLVTIDGEWQSPQINRKSFTTIFIVTMVLFVGWLPSIAMGLMRKNFSPQLRVSSQILLASVSWLNVIVYYVRNKAFRGAGRNFLLKITRNCCGYYNKKPTYTTGHNNNSI
ncbi:probable G-protein coupled receptor 21 [Asterias rubens]|uniref:probable G-protein coupled receptor 21 n=1 Tax=Asterias rubens TaxID=7604 RepID=UPI00145515D3|nr:probable G-protein coupled receptor 21 [Asterias rubens]